MQEVININGRVYNKESFKNVVDTEFKTFILGNNQVPVKDISEQLRDFFDLYDVLFYDIPEEGELSHRSIIERSSDYINISLQDLIDEINLLREENIGLKNQINRLTQ